MLGDLRLVTFMTDFGLRDPSAGVLSGVVLAMTPNARTLDLTHAIPPYDVEAGAEALVESLVHLPVGAHVAVVDPGVGTQRRPIAIRCARGDVLIGPDNGLLLPAAQALGGIAAVVVLDDERWWGPNRSHTFHGRDLFAPVAAHLAAGVRFGDLGSPLDASLLVPAASLPLEVKGGELHTVVRIVDGFGTLVLAGDRSDISAALGTLEPGLPLTITIGDQTISTVWANRFGDVPEGAPLCYIDSAGRLALAVNRGSAAERYKATRRTPVVITRA
ncbi:MAG: S-adenosyl-l-methionine hydroxide adenosyltransferase family protein [Candidatus Limnocylindrus sp.]